MTEAQEVLVLPGSTFSDKGWRHVEDGGPDREPCAGMEVREGFLEEVVGRQAGAGWKQIGDC